MLFLHKISNSEIYFKNLPEIIVKRAEEKKKQADKAQTLSAYSSVYKLLSVLGLNDEIVLCRNGKPVLKNEKAYISLSHSGDFVLCGLSRLPIGVDVEKRRHIDLKIARRFCSEKELENGIDEQTFFRLWTLKEAYFKLYGSVDNIKQTEFSFEGQKVICSDKKIKARSFYKNDLAIAVCEKII